MDFTSTAGFSAAPEPLPEDREITELSLLLPRAQALGLIEAAARQGVTVAQLLRRLVSQALTEPAIGRATLR